MKKSIWTIRENHTIAQGIWKMVLEGNTADIRPGQFVNIEIPGKYLRRPISVCDTSDNRLTIIYKTVGEGTLLMSQMTIGQTLDILTGLGNGYDLTRSGDRPLLAGGGVGVPPLYALAKALRKEGKNVQVVLGFNTQNDVFLVDEFRALGCQVDVVTMDGSLGHKGLIVDYLPKDSSYYYACGPLKMLEALMAQLGNHGEVSMEERMGCGFGICVGCSIETNEGIKRVCKEGPVFRVDRLKK